MMLLLDTHVWIWLLRTPEKLTPAALAQIESAEERILSVASVWEIAIKSSIGRLGTIATAQALRAEILQQIGATELPILAEHAVLAASLPQIHKDPFDRMLVAQARLIGATSVAADEQVRAYGGDVLWAKA
jgi:PIN domain nuclease of toxin-antitoxin system